MSKEKALFHEAQFLNPVERAAFGRVDVPTELRKDLDLPYIASETRFTSNDDSVEVPPVTEAPKVPKEYRRLRFEGALSLLSSVALILFAINPIAYALVPAVTGFALGRFIQSIKYEPQHLRGFSLMISILSGWCLYNVGSLFWPLLFAGPVAATIGGAVLLSAAMAVLIGANARSIVSLFRGKE